MWKSLQVISDTANNKAEWKWVFWKEERNAKFCVRFKTFKNFTKSVLAQVPLLQHFTSHL